jgi:hypothetical protein
LRFIYRNFPLTEIHPHALPAALAAEAAAAQGKFWEMHDYIFHHQHALEDADLAGFAEAVGLDLQQYTRDMAERRARPHRRRCERGRTQRSARDTHLLHQWRHVSRVLGAGRLTSCAPGGQPKGVTIF